MIMKVYIAAMRNGEASVNEVIATVKNGVATFDDGAGAERTLAVSDFGTWKNLFYASDGAVSAVGKTQKTALRALGGHFCEKMKEEVRAVRAASAELAERKRKMHAAHAMFSKIKKLRESV